MSTTVENATDPAAGTSRVISPEQIRQTINGWFLARGLGESALKTYTPRASSAGSCVRSLVYHKLGVPESNPPEPELGLILNLGTKLHEEMTGWLHEMNLPVECHEFELEIPYANGIITGHLDWAIGQTTIVDLKSASRYSFDLMKETNAPLPGYRTQINLYLHGAKLKGLPYTHGLIVAYCKDPGVGQERLPWVSDPLPYDPELAERGIGMFGEVDRHADAVTLPDRPHHVVSDYPCRGCRWRDLCWKIGTELDTEKIADLDAMSEIAIRADRLNSEWKAMKDEADDLRGQLQAALIDAGVTHGHAGGLEAKLIQFDRDDINPNLLSASARAAATVMTHVTYVKIVPKKDRR